MKLKMRKKDMNAMKRWQRKTLVIVLRFVEWLLMRIDTKTNSKPLKPKNTRPKH